MRLIDADELKKMFMYAEDAEYAKWTLNGVISEIDDMPTVDVLEQIRDEIKDEMDDIASGCIAKYSHDEGYYRGLRWVLRKIDKYKGDEE